MIAPHPTARTKRSAVALPILAALAGGFAVGLALARLPAEVLEQVAAHSGLDTMLPAFQRPIQHGGRVMLATGSGVTVAAIAWSLLTLVIGASARQGRIAGTPRRPMTAADLGTPLMDIPPAPPPVHRLPVDLDQRLASFDPQAVPAVARVPARAVVPLAACGQSDAVVASPPRRPAPPSIEALLRRLEECAG